MQAPELTLAAALRDAAAKRETARHKAIRNLAPALLVELADAGPLWRATDGHPHGEAVKTALWEALERSADAALRSQAAIGLGMLGDPAIVERLAPWIDLEGEDDASRFQRECAVIAISFVGAAAVGNDAGVHAGVVDVLRRALASDAADVRFQAAVALVEVAGTEAEADLREALAGESHPEVRVNLVDALSRLEDLEGATTDALVELIESDEARAGPLGFAAAMVLAGARRPEAGPRLVDGLRDRGVRDQALEGLAVIGTLAPPGTAERVEEVAKAFLTPGVTRARAAYALARLCADRPDGDNPGLMLLEKLAWHPKAAVREAVVDARANLQKLAARR